MAVRAVLRRLLEAESGVEVVAEIEDGEELLRQADATTPAAVVLDLDLPSLGGRELIERLGTRTRSTIFVLTPTQSSDSARLAMSLSNVGVAAIYPKPDNPDDWRNLGKKLAEAIQQVGDRTALTDEMAGHENETADIDGEVRYAAIGASTGGPGAVYEMLSAVEPRLDIGIAVVQHIAEGFEGALVDWLASELSRDIAIARPGERLRRGTVRFAPPGFHLTMDRGGRLYLDHHTAPVGGHRPSAEILFKSLLDHPASRVAAVLLSGMGSDGAEAMAELRRARVLTVVQSEATCAVFGMPRAAIEKRAAAFALPPTEIGRLLARASGAKI
jgi:two-component system chemotaxis response regulator CheB